MRLALVSLVFAGSMIGSRPARADDKPSAPVAWGVMGGELATAGVFAANFNGVWANHGPALALNFTPIVAVGAAAYGAYAADLDARPALAVHGAAWLGTDLFLLGALIDGREKAFGLRAGPTAWTLGIVGAIAGGVLGATEFDRDGDAHAWLAGPPAGFVAGGLLLGGALVLAGGIDGDKASGQFATGAVAGTTIGLAAALYLAHRHSSETTAPRMPPGEPARSVAIVPGDGRFVVSFGGAF